MLSRRAHTPEFMDDPAISRDELREHLRFIRMVNRRLGGTSAATGHFRRWSRDWNQVRAGAGNPPLALPDARHAIRILDLGTGSADIPLAIAQWAQRAGLSVHITAVDLHPVTVELAHEHVGTRSDIAVMQADALRLMDHFAPASFDYAHAGMFLHHLQDIEIMTVLRIMDRLATRGIIWNDLTRDALSHLGVRLLSIAATPKLRHDAVVSVAKGFTRREAIEIATRAGLANVRFTRHVFGRFTLTSEKIAAGRINPARRS